MSREGLAKKAARQASTYPLIDLHTVKMGNFDHLSSFKIVLKLFPNIFLPFFLHKNLRELWYFCDPNLNTRSVYLIFFKNGGWSILPFISLTSNTKENLFINPLLGHCMVISTYIQVCKKFFGLLESNSPKIAKNFLKNLKT
jgi:hypothetical protein